MVRTIDQFDSRSVNAAASKTDENVKKDGQNIGAMLSKINNVNNPTTPLSAITASTTIPQPLQPLKALKGIDKPLSKPGSPRKELLVDSPISDFREVQRDFQHPALLLNILPDQKDREVFTEYDKICNEVLAALSEIEMAIEEMTLWKDDFLKQSAPSNVKLQMTLMFARVFRRYYFICE